MTVTAEGAETAAELAVLREARCGQVQGFFFARPMDGSAFEAWRQDRPARREGGVEVSAVALAASRG